VKLETLKRAKVIEALLREIELARQRWRDECENNGFHTLAPFIGGSNYYAPSVLDVASNPIPAPLLRFRDACLDVLATQEAALRAELEAL
jgi:hypothetical protein